MPGNPLRASGCGSPTSNVQSGLPEKASSAYMVPFHEPTYATPPATVGDAETAPGVVPVETNQRTASPGTVPRLTSPSAGLKRLRARSKPYVGQSARAGHAAGAGAPVATSRLPATNIAVPPKAMQ